MKPLKDLVLLGLGLAAIVWLSGCVKALIPNGHIPHAQQQVMAIMVVPLLLWLTGHA